MARSQFIWVVVRDHVPFPYAAFTVKHELVSWLRKQPAPASFTVFKVKDNPTGDSPLPQLFSMEELGVNDRGVVSVPVDD